MSQLSPEHEKISDWLEGQRAWLKYGVRVWSESMDQVGLWSKSQNRFRHGFRF